VVQICNCISAARLGRKDVSSRLQLLSFSSYNINITAKSQRCLKSQLENKDRVAGVWRAYVSPCGSLDTHLANKPQMARTTMQSLGIFLLVQWGMKQVMGGGAQQQQVVQQQDPSGNTINVPVAKVTGPIPYSARADLKDITNYNNIPQYVSPLWAQNTPMDISLYISPSLTISPLAQMPAKSLVLHEKKFVFGNWTDTRDIHTTISLPKEVQNNGTLWGHFFVAKSGMPNDPSQPGYDASSAFFFSRPLTQYITRKRVAKTRNLLAGASEADDVEEDLSANNPTITGQFWHPNFTLSVVPDAGVRFYAQMHPGIREFIQLDRTGARDASGQNGWYQPLLFLNTFWQLKSHMIELNHTITEVPLNIHLNSLSHWKFQLLASMDYGMKANAEKAANGESVPGGGTGAELEQVKQILLDSNIYLLATTVIVGLLHTLFEMLAFKNVSTALTLCVSRRGLTKLDIGCHTLAQEEGQRRCFRAHHPRQRIHADDNLPLLARQQ